MSDKLSISPGSAANHIIFQLVAVIVIQLIALPIIVDVGDDHHPHPGMKTTYTAEANIEGATFTFSGDAMQWQTVEGNTVTIIWGEQGTFHLNVLATTEKPHQTAERTYSFLVTEPQPGSNLIPIIPIFIIIGAIIIIIRSVNSRGGTGLMDGDGFGRVGGGFGNLGGKFGRR